MNIKILELPESAAHYAIWLEDQMISPDFGQLLGELWTLKMERYDETEDSPLDVILAGQKANVLHSGLGCLSCSQVCTLLKNPEALEDLLLEIHATDRPYWLSRLATNHAPTTVLPLEIPGVFTTRHMRAMTDSDAQVTPKGQLNRSPSRRTWLFGAMLATAALVLLVFNLRQPEQASGWGWQREGVFTANLQPSEYLKHLADSADQWFNKTPSDLTSLRTQLVDFRAGCDRLVAAPHSQIAEEDRAWLVERCRAWSARLDEHIAAIDSGATLKDVQSEADQTVKKLIKAILERSDSVST